MADRQLDGRSLPVWSVPPHDCSELGHDQTICQLEGRIVPIRDGETDRRPWGRRPGTLGSVVTAMTAGTLGMHRGQYVGGSRVAVANPTETAGMNAWTPEPKRVRDRVLGFALVAEGDTAIGCFALALLDGRRAPRDLAGRVEARFGRALDRDALIALAVDVRATIEKDLLGNFQRSVTWHARWMRPAFET